MNDQQVEPCPWCGRTEDVRLTHSSDRVTAWRRGGVAAWKCSVCSTEWATSVVNPPLRTSGGSNKTEKSSNASTPSNTRLIYQLGDDEIRVAVCRYHYR